MRLNSVLDRLFRRGRLEDAMEEEMRSHMAERAVELQRAGVAPADAERRARLEFGSVENYKEQCRETRPLHFLHGFVEDLRFGLRILRRSPGLSALAVVCLTIGIGANAAVFSWIEGILLRPFPLVAHQERLMALTTTTHGRAGEPGNVTGVSWPDFLDFRQNCKSLDAFIADRLTGTTLSVGDRAERAVGSVVSANYFAALGVRPILGRGFAAEEEVGRNSHPVVVISYQLWQERFRGDPNLVGKTQLFNGVPHTIVGVAPEGFYGTFVGWAQQFWVPVSMQEKFDPTGYKLEDRGARWIEGFVRLKPGVTPAQAQQEISAVAKRLEDDYPATNRARGIRLYPLWQTPFNGAATLLPTLAVALGVVVLVLLIACANVSNLLLVRAFGRRHEMTVRLAVGAKRSRLVRQLLTEGLLLSALGAAGGLLCANWCRNVLVLLLPSRGSIRMNLPGEVDGRVLALSIAVGVFSTALFALVPALQASHVDLAGTLKAESGGVVTGRRRGWVRSALVLVQVALSFVLLVGAGLLLQSLRALRSISPGFSARRVLTTSLDFFAAGYDPARIRDFEDRLVDRLQSLPAVESAAFSRITPFEYRGYSSAPVAVDGYESKPGELPTIAYNEVGPGYLATTGIALRSGREFTRADNENAPPVAIVNEVMAAQFWPGQSPLGRRIQVQGRWMRVVGVAPTIKYRNLEEQPIPFFYVPLRQSSVGEILSIRTWLAPATMAPMLLREVRALDPNLAPGETVTMQRQVDRTMAPQRLSMMMLCAFGVLALLLAAVGLYGVLSYTVSQCTRELGVRMALGAARADLLWLVMARGLGLTAAGIVAGAVVATATSRLLGYLLYRVSPHDPLAFGSAFLVMTLAGAAACFVPAWRAARVDPLRALRS